MEKHSESRLSDLFAHLHLLSSYSFSSTLLSSDLSLLSASALLCFSSVHTVGSLTSKLPSISYNAIANGSRRHTKNASAPSVRADLSMVDYITNDYEAFSQERLRRVLCKKETVVIHLQIYVFTLSHLQIYIFTPSHLQIYIFTPSHLQAYIFTLSHLQIYIVTPSHLLIYIFTPSHLQTYNFSPSHLQIHTFSPSHLETLIFTPSHLLIYIFTPSHLQIYIFTPSHLQIYFLAPSHLQIFSLLLSFSRSSFYLSLKTGAVPPERHET